MPTGTSTATTAVTTTEAPQRPTLSKQRSATEFARERIATSPAFIPTTTPAQPGSEVSSPGPRGVEQVRRSVAGPTVKLSHDSSTHSSPKTDARYRASDGTVRPLPLRSSFIEKERGADFALSGSHITTRTTSTATPTTDGLTPSSISRAPLRRTGGLLAYSHVILRWAKHMGYLVYSVLMLAWEVAAGVLGVPIAMPEYEALEGQLRKAQSFAEWRVLGRMLDDLDGFAEWRTEESSVYFNFEGVMRCMQEFAELKRNGNTRALLDVLLCRVHRSLYGVNNSQLYLYRTGTKNIIHSYTSLVCYLIRDLANTSAASPPPSITEAQTKTAPPPQPSREEDIATVGVSGLVTPQQRYDALHQMRIVYGCTALVLNGSTVVGPLHLGVAKALYEADLLPQVIYGYRSGAIVAALICCKQNLSQLLREHGINFHAIAGKDKEATTMRRWQRLLREGHLMDAGVLLRFMRDNVGEITFMDAYRRTGRILNIQYTSFYHDEATGRTQKCSCLLNYLTAPHVLVYSAAVSSLASVPVMFAQVPLLARNMDGRVVEYDPAVLVHGYPQQLSDDGNSAPETSLHRLRELFHVQYFIVSECSTLMKPSFLRRQEHSGLTRHLLLGWLHFILTEVVRLLWWLLCLTPLEPHLATVMDNDMAECGVTGDAMVLIPRLSWGDLRSLWGSLSRDDMRRCVLASERQVWPRLEEIRMSQAIEHAITDTMAALREEHPFDIKG